MAGGMLIKTASWFTPLPDDHIRIGISRGVPRFSKIGKGYRVYRRLAPGPWFNSTDTQDAVARLETWAAAASAAVAEGLRARIAYREAAGFTALYREVLSKLDPPQVVDELMRIADGKIPVLCCFEKVGGPQWCHRSQAAAWLSEALGCVVPEFGHENLPQVRHPLLPQELV